MGEILSIEDREDRDAEFIREYVNNGGNATLAAKAVGVSAASASTVGHRLKMRLLPDIEAEAKNQLKGYVVPALQRLKDLVEGAQSESVQLGAIKDVLDRAGLKPIDRQQVEQVSSLDNMSNEDLQSELDSLFEQEYGLTQDQLKKVVKGQQH